MENEAFFCNLTALFWKYYILEPTKEHFDEIFSYFSEQLVLIGTGKHEFYTNTTQILDSLKENQVEAESIHFHVLDEWYECLMISPEVYLVYGGIWVRQKKRMEHEALIEMDTRFSVLYRKQNDTCKIIHLHHSIPYIDQQNGEYYPKTLSKQATDAILLAKLFEKKSETDLMTELYNNISFRHRVIQQMAVSNKGTLYLFDLDYFKKVNDTYGHITGDELLKLFSHILKQYFAADAVIGRMGGDEFAVFEFVPLEQTFAIQKITRIQTAFNRAARTILCDATATFSVGIVSLTTEGSSYDDLFITADHALYHAKQLGRQTYCWQDVSKQSCSE